MLIYHWVIMHVVGRPARASIGYLTFWPFQSQRSHLWLAILNLLPRDMNTTRTHCYAAAWPCTRLLSSLLLTTWYIYEAREWESCRTTWCSEKQRVLCDPCYFHITCLCQTPVLAVGHETSSHTQHLFLTSICLFAKPFCVHNLPTGLARDMCHAWVLNI